MWFKKKKKVEETVKNEAENHEIEPQNDENPVKVDLKPEITVTEKTKKNGKIKKVKHYDFSKMEEHYKILPEDKWYKKAYKWWMLHWGKFAAKHKVIAQFIVFFIVSNGVTLLQLALMPLFRYIFSFTPLQDIAFQVFPVGHNIDGSQYYIFDYAAGAITAEGKCGGLAYFLAVQITLGIAQVINFFAQRNMTFKHTGNPWWAAMWYLIAYIAITFIAGALQGLYKAPIYGSFKDWFGGAGETLADIVTMIINSAISFWVFFPIFKIIFKNKKENKPVEAK